MVTLLAIRVVHLCVDADREIGSIGIKISSKEWYSKKIGLIKMERIEETDTDLFGTTKMVQLLESYQKF